MTNLILDIDSKKMVTNTDLSGYLLPEKEDSYLYSFVIDVKINYILNGNDDIVINYSGITYKFLCKKEVKIDNLYKKCYLYSPYKISSYQYTESLDTNNYVKNHITYLNILCVPTGDTVNETNFSSKFYLYNLSGNTVYSLINRYNLFGKGIHTKYDLVTFKFYNPITKYISDLGGIHYGNNTLYSTESSPLISGIENNEGCCFNEKTYYNIFGISKNSTKCVTGSHLEKIKINYIRPLIGSFFKLDDEGYCSPINNKIIDIEDIKQDAHDYNYEVFFIAPYVHGYKEFLKKNNSGFEIEDENIVIDTFLVDSTTNSFITGSTTDIRYGIDSYIEDRNTIHFDDYYVRTFSEKTVTIKKDIEDGTQNDIFIDEEYGLIHKYIIEDVYSNIKYNSKALVNSGNCVIKNVKYGDKIYQGDIILNRPPVIVPGIVSSEYRNESNNIYYYKLSYMDIDIANQYRDPNTLEEIEIEEDENANAIIPVKCLKFKLDSECTSFEDKYSNFFRSYSDTATTLEFTSLFNDVYLHLCESIYSGPGEHRFKKYLDSNDLTIDNFEYIIEYILPKAFIKLRLTFDNDSTYYYLDCGSNYGQYTNDFVSLDIVNSDSDNYLTASLRGGSYYMIKRVNLTDSKGNSVTVNRTLRDINKLQIFLYFKEDYIGNLKDYFDFSESILIADFNITD